MAETALLSVVLPSSEVVLLAGASLLVLLLAGLLLTALLVPPVGTESPRGIRAMAATITRTAATPPAMMGTSGTPPFWGCAGACALAAGPDGAAPGAGWRCSVRVRSCGLVEAAGRLAQGSAGAGTAAGAGCSGSCSWAGSGADCSAWGAACGTAGWFSSALDGWGTGCSTATAPGVAISTGASASTVWSVGASASTVWLLPPPAAGRLPSCAVWRLSGAMVASSGFFRAFSRSARNSSSVW